MQVPPAPLLPGGSWLGLTTEPLPLAEAHAWVVEPRCGGVVAFTGTVRDHAEGRTGVTGLTYEAYEEVAVERLAAVADEVRNRYPGVGRVVLHHRLGPLELGDAAVSVVVAAPHRDEAFAAARFAIDAVKASVPIWKHEAFEGGAAWGTGAEPLVDPSAVASAGAA